MRRNLLVAGVVGLPILLWANAGGPPFPGLSGAPGEGNCTQCHVGQLNPSGGSFTITASGGDNYAPGVAQTITLNISDSVANRVYGFQASVRTRSDVKINAGTLRATQGNTSVVCSSADFTQSGTKPSSGCPTSQPLESVQHNTRISSSTITFEWTPSATAQGEVVIYVAVNSANNNGQNSGDRIFTNNKSLNVQASATPTIDTGGVVSLLAFGGGTTMAPGGWAEIYGNNLSTTTREWAGSDFSGSNAPTTLDGVSVSIGGRPAFMRFVSPRQLNIQVPDLSAGPHTLTITNSSGTSANYTAQVAARVPGFQAPASFKIGDRQYVTVIHPDTTTTATVFYGGLTIAGTTFRGLAPGRQFTLYGVGMGATNPASPAGQIVGQASNLPNVILRAGNTQLQTMFGGLVPTLVGLYSFNVVAPDIADGDHAFTGTIDGVAIPANLFINIRRDAPVTPPAPTNPGGGPYGDY